MGIYEIILNMNPALLALLIAFLVNLFSTLVYKKVTDQKEIKKMKAKMKDIQKEIKKLQSQPEKAMKKQKEMMELSGKQMKQSFKPMIYTMIPLFLLFAWINSSLIYDPLMPNMPFDVTASFTDGISGNVTLTSIPADLTINNSVKEILNGMTTWKISGPAGTYSLIFKGKGYEVQKKILITEERKYEKPTEKYKGLIKTVEIGNERVRPFGNFMIFGWKPGMLGAYILLSVLFSIILRKLFKIA